MKLECVRRVRGFAFGAGVLKSQRGVRSSLLAGTSLVGAAAVLSLFTVAVFDSAPAFADGGAGGSSSAFGNTASGGAGGTDSTAAQVGNTDFHITTVGGGGGGGGAADAGGAAGGAGDFRNNNSGGGGGGTGGTGGTGTGSSNGSQNGAGGGGGGGGGSSGLITTQTDNVGLLSGSDGGGGGNGGNGGNQSAGGGGGGGGQGGYGLVLNGANTASSNGTNIFAGSGGGGGNGGASASAFAGVSSGSGGNGGDGGAGVKVTVSGVTFTNNGLIIGGSGGLAGAAGTASSLASAGGAGANGAGGAGITGFDLTVINSGIIQGGLGGDGVTRANAVQFTGGTNTYEMQSGGTVSGLVVAASTADTFRLGGGTSDTFDLSQLGPAGTYQGFGILAKSGTSTWTVSNTPGTTMALQVSAGTISFTSAQTFSGLQLTGGTISGAQITVNGPGGFDVQSGTINSALAGSGALTKSTSGTVTLFGTNSYTGGTFVNAGTLIAVGTNALGDSGSATTVAGGVLDLDGFAQTQNGGVVLTGGTIQTGRLSSSGLFDMQSGTVSAELDGSGGLTKSTSGIVTLMSTNAYTGATVVNGGTLLVNGDITHSSGVTVNSGGTLGGTGTVGNTLINAGGTLAPGTLGTAFNVHGTLGFDPNATYAVQVSPLTADRTIVTGTATLGGATVNAIFQPGSYVAKQYTILTAHDFVGSFNSTVTNTNLPSGFKTTLSNDATNVFLNLALTFGVPSSGLSGNQGSVGNALTNYFNANGGIPMAFGMLTPGGLSQASGESTTSTQQTTFGAMTQFLGTMFGSHGTDGGAGGTAGGGSSGYADEEALGYAAREGNAARDAFARMPLKADPRDLIDPRWSVWAAGYGGSQTTDGNTTAGTNKSNSRFYGMAVGADYRFRPDLVGGFVMAGGGTNFGVAGSGTGSSDLFQMGAFLRKTFGPAYLTGGLAYAWQDITTNRTVTIAGTDRLQARFTANALSGRIESGYRFVTPWMGLTPYAAGQFTTFYLPSYGETALAGTNTFALSYASKDVTASRSELGARTDKSFAVSSDTMLTLGGRLAWAHNFNPSASATATFQSLPGATFVVNGAAEARDAALTTASAEWKWRNGWSVAGLFEGEFSDVTRSYAGKGTVRYTW